MGSDKLSMQFYHALRKRSYPRVSHLVLNEGMCTNHMFADGSFPIHVAAERGDVQNLKFLLLNRASPNMKNRHGQTALMLGILWSDVVQALIDHGCKVNISDSQRRTALHLAGARGLPDVIKILLEAGARPNDQDKWGRTALHVTLINVTHGQVASKEYVDVVQLLLTHQSDVNCPDHHRSRPLFLAVNTGNEEIFELLMSHGARPDQYSRHHLTPLMLGAMKGHESICLRLLEFNCSVNRTNPVTSKSALQIAVQKGHINIAKMLVAAGAHLHEECWLFRKNFPRKASDDMRKWLHNLVSTPLPLKLLSRTTLRATLGPNIVSKVEKLSYPEPLKKYILLKPL